MDPQPPVAPEPGEGGSTLNHQPPSVGGPTARRWTRRLVCLAAFCFLLSAFCLVFRASLLTGLANAWIINENPAKADAIVVLGGGVDYRPFEAARLYNEGFAPKVLIMELALGATEEIGLKQPERSVTESVLLRHGVSAQAVVGVGRAVRNTYQESVAVRDWARANNAKCLLIITETFHTRRVRWLFRKQFKGTGTEIRVVAAGPREYAATNWWRNEQGLINFQNEWVKLPYYWLKY